MRISTIGLLRGATWTTAAYGAGLLLRLISTMTLTRLLAPELFGIMVVVYSIRVGIELILSDAGLGTNIVYNRDGNKPEFYNTAWSIQFIRGLILCVATIGIAAPLSYFYKLPVLLNIIPVVAISFLFSGFSSMSFYLLQRGMQVGKINTFEFIVQLFSVTLTILLAYLSPTIWALVLGSLAEPAARFVGSYYLIPGLRHKFYISKEYLVEIFKYGRWIFLASIVFFFSINFDRLYLAKMIPLELLGVYGIARALSEIITNLFDRLTNLIFFPLVTSSRDVPRAQLREQLAPIRLKVLLLLAVGMSLAIATADFLIRIMYDSRYAAAGWMLPFLLIGAWFYILGNLNKAALLGIGKSEYSAISDSVKLGYVMVFVTLGFTKGGVPGVIVVMATIDLCRYGAILFGQVRERFSFGTQDFGLTIILFILIGFWQWLRWIVGLGTSFQSLPIAGFG